MPHDLERKHPGGAGRSAACVFPGPGDVSLDQADGLEDLSQFARESEGIRGACRQPGPLQRLSRAGLIWGLDQDVPAFAFQTKAFFLLCVIVAGVYGASTVSRRILFVQAAPAAIALILLWLA